MVENKEGIFVKCVSLAGPKKLVVEDRKAQEGKEGYILIDVIKAGICGSDIHYWVSGEPKGLVMGHEFSGVVIDNGGSKKFKEGDSVVIIKGEFKGIEGHVARWHGQQRVAIIIKGLCTIATAYIPSGHLEKT